MSEHDEAMRDIALAVDQIREERAKRRATHAEVAQRAGVTVQTLCNMNAGRGTATLETLARTARALGLRVALLPVEPDAAEEQWPWYEAGAPVPKGEW